MVPPRDDDDLPLGAGEELSPRRFDRAALRLPSLAPVSADEQALFRHPVAYAFENAENAARRGTVRHSAPGGAAVRAAQDAVAPARDEGGEVEDSDGREVLAEQLPGFASIG